ncbi:MAG TPA: lipopolysaccharide heptosyltransferase I [Candidatus Sulfotelmatobacter sp.]|nr:lipopolysaccharide heptosyltransferase I [Candidatus Sulfotelmatobacter sp.]
MTKILIVRLGAMGDILHALPAVAAIRAALPNATLGWLVEEHWSELLTAQGRKASPSTISPRKPLVNHVHTIDTRRWRKHFFRISATAEVLGAIKRVRKLKYDIALDFQGSIKSAILARLAGAEKVVGFANPREPAARFLYREGFPRSGEHVIEQNHGLAAQALKPYLDCKDFALVEPQLPHDHSAESWAESEIAGLGIASFVIVNPGAGWGAKQWPPQRFGEVARALALHNIKTLVNAAAGEEGLAHEVMEASSGNAFELRCTIGQFIALMRRARLFIGGDTGPLHLAAALGIPVVALFGPTDPARTGPFGTKAIALRHPESETTFSHHSETEAGLMKITTEEVISAARHLLGSNHA